MDRYLRSLNSYRRLTHSDWLVAREREPDYAAAERGTIQASDFISLVRPSVRPSVIDQEGGAKGSEGKANCKDRTGTDRQADKHKQAPGEGEDLSCE